MTIPFIYIILTSLSHLKKNRLLYTSVNSRKFPKITKKTMFNYFHKDFFNVNIDFDQKFKCELI